MFSFKRQIGNQAETIALKYLSKQGLKFITQNYLTPLGEIDLIMLDKADNELVFIEVRYRQNTKFGDAAETVNYKKQAKITKTAQHYLQHQQKYENFTCRFDVVGVESDLKYPKINWIKNAF
ncbi:MAG: YraN family protein [Candidatus Thioglobus sp.]|nr:YraN family protein [Candidatus Thioglobus sp.]